MLHLPTISIITVVYNGVNLLEGTILSVLQQSYPQIEYIIVDGASNDGTVEVIRRFDQKIAQWISEPDRGLYDAMNKGLQMTTGDFVWFLNAGDHLFAADTVEKMVACYSPKTDVFFGEVMLVNDARQHLGTRSENTTRKLPKSLNWKSLQKGMVVCHQAFVPRKSLTTYYQANNLAADIDWVIYALKQAREVTPTHLILAEYLEGGISQKRHWQSLKDRYAVLNKHYGWLANLWNHFYILRRAVWSKFNKK